MHGARGYTPFKTETAKDSLIADLKEFWHVGRELSQDDPYRKWMPENIDIVDLGDKHNFFRIAASVRPCRAGSCAQTHERDARQRHRGGEGSRARR